MSSVETTAVVYARYSSHGQTEQSIEGQIAAAQKYAEQHGYTIIHIYADRAMTGRNDDREEFQKMLSDTATRQFGVILLWKIDRFGRNREEIAFNRYRCKKNGVRVERVAEDVPDGPEGVILDSVLEGMAEYYSLQLAQNVRRGQRESAKKSQTVGGCKIIGYNVNPDTKRYEVDPKTAPFVTEVFKRYANGETISEIVAWLNAQGVRTTRGGEFTVNSLHRLLKNEKYTGVYIFHDIRNEGGMPALIDRATFDKAQEMLKVNRRAPARVWSKTEYLLTDKLFCGHCGTMMVGESGHGRNGTKHNYYTCWNRKKKKTCDKKPIRQDVIEPLVLSAIGKLLENPATLENIADQVWAAYERSDTSGDTIKALDKQIADVDRALSNVMKAIEMGIINEMTKARMDELTDQKQALSAARAEAGLAGGFKLTRDMILFFLQDMAALDRSNRDCQKRLIKTFVNAIYLYDDHFDIAFNYTSNGKMVVKMQEINDTTSGEVFGRCAQSPAKDRQCKADGLFVFIYRKISGKQVGQTANTVLPVLCMCCVLLMGLPAGSVCFHIKIRLQMPWPSCAMLGLATTVGANMFARQLNETASFPGWLFTQKVRAHIMRPQRVEKTSAKQTPPDARKVALAPEAKGGKHTFFDIQRTITVLPLYIALMRFLIKLNSIICLMYPMPATML